MADTPTVLTGRAAAGTAVITLNAPQRRNVLSSDMVRGLDEAFSDAEADSEIRCVVLTGAGAAFCAGAELSTLEQAAAGDFSPVREVYDGFLRVLACPLPVIAAVNGPAVGAGCNLALACDVRLAGAAARFDTRFAALHLHPGGGHTWLLARAVGFQQAVLACLFGEVWDARSAHAHGLVASVHEPDDLLPAASALAARLAHHDPEFVRKLVGTLRAAASGEASRDQVLEMETAAQRWSVGQTAFLGGVAGIRSRLSAARRPSPGERNEITE